MHTHQKPIIAFIGAGVMAEVIINGLLTRGVVPPEHIWASGPRQERGAELTQTYGIHVTTRNQEAAQEADIIVLSVKPQSLAKVLLDIRPAIRDEHLIMSIIAGARMSLIGNALDHPAVVRCMPNLPCRIHRGMTVWTSTDQVSSSQHRQVSEILRPMGKEIRVEDELDVDRATAVNGTGPAMIAYFVKSLEDAANYIGESRPLARQSVLQTIIGTAEMILQSEQHVAELIDGVTSPGGTTSRALHVLRKGRFSANLTDAIDAAFARSVELGDLLDKRMDGLASRESVKERLEDE